MKYVRCDHKTCRAEAVADPIFGSAPDGWTAVATKEHYDLHFCSDRCVSEYFHAAAEDRLRPAKATLLRRV